MYLKRLEMIGFKSFPEKIRLEFNTGITAVVGPNGSGKSNVSDAVRWVLGEQSAKSLRGAKMEDVIFAGTANRKPLGYAEVTMTIDNSNKGLKTEYEEVSVTRRVYRSGESEYSINGVNCRLKDIHTLFMDTGIGKEGYSIIGQGKIEEVLSSKSDERRLLFEEAAGIIKYKTRRFDALSKLEREKANLERVTDIIKEIELSLGPLKVQSEKASQYLKLIEVLKEIQINIFIQEVESSEDRIGKLNENIQIVEAQINKTTKTKKENDEIIIRCNKEIEVHENILEQKDFEIAELRSAYEQSENDILLRTEQIKHYCSDIENIKLQVSEKTAANLSYSNEIDKLSNTLNEIVKEQEEKNAQLMEREKDFKDFSGIMSDEELASNDLNEKIIEIMQQIAQIGNDIGRAENSYEQLENRLELIKEELRSLNKKLEDENTRYMELKEILSDFNIKTRRLQNNLEILRIEKEDNSNKLSEAKDKIKSCLNKLNEAKYRKKMLDELEKSYEGYQRPVKKLLSYNKEHPGALNGIIGAVGELLSVDKSYETAIEISLGQSLQNIVTENENNAREAIEYLKKTVSGRATFLPVSTIKSRNYSINSAFLKEPGVIGTAYSLCDFDEKYKDIFHNLLSGSVIIDTIDNAIRLSKKYNYSNKLVTLEGDLFNPGGSITGGSISSKASGIFGRKRELEELQITIEQLSQEENTLNNKITGIRKQLEAIDFQREQDMKNLQSIEVEKSAVTEKLSLCSKSLSEGKERAQRLIKENDHIMNGIVEINSKLRTLETLKSSKENDLESTKEELNKLNEMITTRRLEKDSRYAQLTKLKIDTTVLEEKRTATESKIVEIKKTYLENKINIDKLKDDINKKESSLIERKNEIEKIKSKKEHLSQELISLRSQLEEVTTNLKDLKSRLKSREDESLGFIEVLSNLNNEKSRLDLQKAHIGENLRKIYDAMWQEYEITYQQAKTYTRQEKTLNKLLSEEKTLKGQMKALGSVNIAAIEEFKTLSQRYVFLTKQAADIEEAEAQLKGIISQLTELMEKQFKEHFAIISNNFSSVFSDIFGGGTAYLKLNDGENILESGIDIIAKPPGKALQSLSLLSGGERSLTAAALLFAILRMKPSPFCILDEIESALDDANVVRYVNYLQNFCQDTQFILITHRKSVMEAADVMYGITMQEQGVSTMVSVKFEGESA